MQSPVFVMNPIGLNLVTMHGRLILFLQSILEFLIRHDKLRKPVGSEQCIYSGNKMCLYVEGVGTCSLVLSSDFILYLEKTFYIPSFSKNLISVSRLVLFGYSFQFSDKSFTLYYKSIVVGMVFCLMVLFVLI